MSDKHNDILRQCARRDGLRPPEGYFDDFARRMDEALPQRPELSAVMAAAAAAPKGLWAKVRPYVYMAAMFAGVWCMLKVFTTVAPSTQLQPIESNPVMAEVFGNDDFMNNYVYDELSESDIVDALYTDGVDLDSIAFENE